MLPKLEKGKSPGAYFTRLSYTPKWSQMFLLISDVHFDAMGCNRKLLKKHLDQAQERDAPVFIFGDTMDLMQGKKDPRGAKHKLRREYMFEDYLGAVCEDTAKFLAPYADNIQLIAQGNHELSYKRHHEIDPLSIMTTHIKAETGIRPIVAPYTGWIQFKCQMKTGGRRKTVVLKWTHGVGGNSPVTKGAIQSNRSVAMWPNADVIVRGHIHNRFSMDMPCQKISANGVIHDAQRTYLQTGCYVSDIDDPDSWSEQKSFGSPGLGGYWLKLYCDTTTDPLDMIKWIAYPTD